MKRLLARAVLVLFGLGLLGVAVLSGWPYTLGDVLLGVGAALGGVGLFTLLLWAGDNA